ERQMFWWGIPQIYKLNFNVSALNWDGVSEKIKTKISNRVNLMSEDIKNNINNVKPNIKTRILFNIMRKMQTGNDFNLTDRSHWENNGWIGSERPWK
ncbi:MAG TPA: flavin reductase, partial [Sedimentibacter sp.]|nr:flavin reductase [Sedimentibacter sp.]